MDLNKCLYKTKNSEISEDIQLFSLLPLNYISLFIENILSFRDLPDKEKGLSDVFVGRPSIPIDRLVN